MAYLPRHLESMKEWLPLVEEVVVVDSESTDGTVEFLKKHLGPQSPRFFTHPPGLYQSWNFSEQPLSDPLCKTRYIPDGFRQRRGCVLGVALRRGNETRRCAKSLFDFRAPFEVVPGA